MRSVANVDVGEIVRKLGEDRDYRAAFTARLDARSVDSATIERLVVYARARQATPGQALVRRVLTDAGISWEAL